MSDLKLTFAEVPKETETNEKINQEVRASYGTSVFSGVFDEEYLSTLQGVDGMEVYDKMRRNDDQVGMILNAVLEPLKGANYDIRPWTSNEDDPFSEQAKLHADFVRFQLMEDMRRSWSTLLGEIYTFPIFGHAAFWEVNKYVKGHPIYGDYIGIDQMIHINPKTIERWNFDRTTMDLVSIEQRSQGDIGKTVILPKEFLHLFVNQLEGANYEGFSILRRAYGAWWRKNQYLKLEGVGIERHSVGTIIIDVPQGQEQNPERARLEAIAQRLRAHQLQWVSKPKEWGFEIMEGKFDASTVQNSILKENEAIARSVAANFLNLGQSGAGGAYALSNDLSDFFTSSLKSLAYVVAEQFSSQIIPRLIRLNFGPQIGYPYMEVTGIDDKAGKELAETFKILSDSRAIYWTDNDENHVRERFGLPERQDFETSGRAYEAPVNANPFASIQQSQKKNKRIVKFAKSKAP
ncbi:MAG: hypothetical protein KC483_10905, partial [Nitrosarchaeum sp.]|nr:hypothetical protein [Nitrosarchaeum sp.]